jgi:thiol-disulfide isomerase/thioredoxin
MKATPLVIGFVLLAAVAGGLALTWRRAVPSKIGASGASQQPVTSNQQRALAPDFSFRTLDGTSVSTARFRCQKAVLVNAWAIWCPFCVDELADFATLADEFPNDLEVVAINRAESEDSQRSYLADLKGRNLLESRLRFLVDPADEAYRRLGGFGMPITTFIRKDGTVAFVKSGPMELEEMRELVKTHVGVGQ